MKRRRGLAHALGEIERNWEIYGRADPLWAILMDPDKRGGRWDRDQFFATGEAEIRTVLDHLHAHSIEPDFSGAALDFGCGAGRLTQALAERFAFVQGVDISASMIALAIELNRRPERCHYLVNQCEHLGMLQADTFSFVYSSIVLQHMHPQFALGYLAEFARVLCRGGTLVFQVPERLNPGRSINERAGLAMDRVRARLAVRTRMGRMLRSTGIRRGAPDATEAVVEMHCIAEPRIRQVLQANGLRIADVRLTNSTSPRYRGNLRYLDAEPPVGYVSKQYCAVKPALED